MRRLSPLQFDLLARVAGEGAQVDHATYFPVLLDCVREGLVAEVSDPDPDSRTFSTTARGYLAVRLERIARERFGPLP